MLNFTYKDTPNMEQYAEDIGAEGTFAYINRSVLQLFYANCVATFFTVEHSLRRLISELSRGCLFEVKSQHILDILRTQCGIPDHKLILRDKTGSRLSLDMSRIVDPLLDSLVERLKAGVPDVRTENAVDLLSMYKDYQAAKTRRDQCRSKLEKLSEEEYEGWGIPLNKVEFEYVMSETGRFYTRNDNLQNWPLEIVPAISADKDHFLVWADFDQIDMRVGYHLFLREPGSQVDKIYLAADDKYRAMYEIICRAANKQPDFELFEKYRKAYKKAILSAMYNASEASLIEDIKNKELAHELFEFFQNNTRYQAYRKTIDKAIQFNVDLSVRDYFGFIRDIPMPSLKNNREINDAVSKCCNTPVQSTSNSIVVNWVEGLLAEFEKYGYKRGEDVQPYLIRHDECVFRVSSRVFPDLWIFRNCMEVAIDDWDLLSLEPHCGVSYKVPMDALESAFQQSCLANADKMTPRLVNSPREETYRAISEVLDVYAYSFKSFIDHAKEIVIEHPEFGVSPDIEWTDDLAADVISRVASGNEFYTELLEFRNKMVIYSPKMNKYRLISGFDYVVETANHIGTNKVNCHSLTITRAAHIQGLMFRFLSNNPEDTKRIMRGVRDAGFPEGWVALA